MNHNKSKQKKVAYDKPLFVEIPGFFIEAEIDIPLYDPHTLWHLAYITELLKGRQLNEIIKNPPWPIPNDDIIIKQLIKELIDKRWIIPNWKTNKIVIDQKIKDIYSSKGEIGLCQELLKCETFQGEWWVDAVSGTLLSRLTALHYDVDTSRKSPPNTIFVKSQNEPDDILRNKNFNIVEMIQAMEDKSSLGTALYNRAYLSSKVKITGKKNIRFRMHSDSQKRTSILPNDLEVFETMLLENKPEIFGEKRKITRRLFKWNRSPIEKFALYLEKFPSEIFLVNSKKYYTYLVQLLFEQLNNKTEWLEWYTQGLSVEPIVGVTDIFFNCLSEICSDKKNENKDLVITSSFLNKNNLFKDDGLIGSIQNLPGKILIIYGHANDETLEQQKETIKNYKERILELKPSLGDKLVFVTAKKRTHEKIIISSTGDWFTSSWNACSSRPESTQFESGLKGSDRELAKRLVEIIKELIEDPIGIKIITKIENQLAKSKKNKTNLNLVESIFNLMKKSTILLGKIINTDIYHDDFDKIYKKTIEAIRLLLMPFLKRSKIELINEHQSRDVLITQIKNCKEDIFLATDRVSSSALDSSILNDIFISETGSKKYLRILWGREWENEENISKDARNQLKEARHAIRNAIKFLGNQIITRLTPMENHAKFALFDGARGLITSENILSYGGEKDKYESRELGIFIESIPIIRYIQGKAVKHRLNHFHPQRQYAEMTYRPYEWVVEGIEHYYSLDQIKDQLDFKWNSKDMIYATIGNELYTKDEFLDKFDEKLNQEKIICFEERKDFVNQDFGDYLFDASKRYYLNYSLDDDTWKPFISNVDLSEIKLIVNKNLPELENIELTVKDIPEVRDEDKKLDNDFINEIMQDMVLIKNGSFMMGNSELFRERPRHEVIISENFYISKFLVTQSLWKKVMGILPQMRPHNIAPNNPVMNVSYNDAQEFIGKLNSLSKVGEFDLPTEAQWEYACRAGATTDYHFGDNPNQLEEYAWTKRNSDGKLHEVGLKKPNNWGLYDMHGLAYESLKDDLRTFTTGIVIDPIGPLKTAFVCYKGGAWTRNPTDIKRRREMEHFRCSYRDHHTKDEKSYRTSFRIIRKIGV